MTTLLMDTPAQVPSQLCFAWPEHEDTTPALVVGAVRVAANAVAANQAAATSSPPPLGRQSIAFGERRCGEVRIGSVMIKLLKRYGITDEEIDQGLADYARQTCRSAAS